jgi:HSP20 family protein
MPWDPVRDLLHMHERLESLFGKTGAQWVPPVDLAEQEDRYSIAMELPGLAREDVTLEYADQVLTLRGVRPAEPSPGRYHQLERGQGTFARSFRFSMPVAADGITADLADGVLTVVVPKVAPDRRRIEVS